MTTGFPQTTLDILIKHLIHNVKSVPADQMSESFPFLVVLYCYKFFTNCELYPGADTSFSKHSFIWQARKAAPLRFRPSDMLEIF